MGKRRENNQTKRGGDMERPSKTLIQTETSKYEGPTHQNAYRIESSSRIIAIKTKEKQITQTYTTQLNR